MLVVNHETAMAFAYDLDESEYRDTILANLEKKDYTLALIVCGEAILQTLKRETDLSVSELKDRMRSCNHLEKLEKMISALAREARLAARERKALAKIAARIRPANEDPRLYRNQR